jgi:hypothetical protein
MLILSNFFFQTLDNKSFFITDNGLKWVKEIEVNQIRKEEKEDSWMGGKQEG